MEFNQTRPGVLELDGSRQDGIHGRRLGGWGDRVSEAAGSKVLGLLDGVLLGRGFRGPNGAPQVNSEIHTKPEMFRIQIRRWKPEPETRGYPPRTRPAAILTGDLIRSTTVVVSEESGDLGTKLPNLFTTA